MTNIAQEGLKIPGLDVSEDDQKKTDEEFKELLTYIKDQLKDKVCVCVYASEGESMRGVI